ncbi:MAG: hypothetical protein AAB515_01715 [Patescibacteria group bacterium]
MDEIAALWLAMRFATPDWVARYCPESVLQLGVGGGAFDEHPTTDNPAKAEDCCTTLMARSLGLSDQPELVQLQKFIFNVDVKGNGSPFDLYNLVKQLNEAHPNDPQKVIDWAFLALDAKHAEQLDFVESQEAVRMARVITAQNHTGDQYSILIVESDHGSVVRAASHMLQRDWVALVQRRSNGHTMVFTNKRMPVVLSEVAKHIRIAELGARGRTEPIPAQDFYKEGFMRDIPWFYNPRGEMLLNGSNTTPNVEPSKLTADQVAACVRVGIEAQWRKLQVASLGR